ncbi:MAG: dynamin family protein [Gammaproteobacteria bacterium]|nr:dynamin family protein [Gammaproteobacteria bacterium]
MIETQIEREFDVYSDWRQSVKAAIEEYRDWLQEQNLGDMDVEERINQLINTLNDDKLYVAFVAEFSRGKSELINAIFFGHLGQRIVPSGAGRTTMCPTEIQYTSRWEPCLKLLPIETRENDTTITEYKKYPDEWDTLPLDPTDADSTSRAMKQLTEVKFVDRERAEALGLTVASDDAHDDGMRMNDRGHIEIPRWRHAIINFPHPLLEKGLVILDTPGLNALGAEPELTLNMLANAHAVVFILAADAGVTKSDLALWRDHISAGKKSAESNRLVILNKIDVLWDELRDPVEVKREIERQIENTSVTLNVPNQQIYPISAQKGLLGKVRQDGEIIDKSRVTELEDALANIIMPAKRKIVSRNVEAELIQIVGTARALGDQRIRDVDDHINELKKLSSRNMEVIEDMMDKVRADKEHLEKNLQRFQATRSVFSRQTNKLYDQLSLQRINRLIAETKKNMSISLTTGGLRTSMLKFFTEVDGTLDSAAKQSREIQELMEGVYRKFQEEHGLANIKPRKFSTTRYQRELRRLMERHDYFIRGLSVVMTEQMVVARRFYDSVVLKVRQIFERANSDADDWLRTIMSPMESQVREHQVQLRRRLESIKRIHKASDTLDDRLAELSHVKEGIQNQKAAMDGFVARIESYLEDASLREGRLEARQLDEERAEASYQARA